MKNVIKAMALGTGGIVLFFICIVIALAWCVYATLCLANRMPFVVWPLGIVFLLSLCCLAIQALLWKVDNDEYEARLRAKAFADAAANAELTRKNAKVCGTWGPGSGSGSGSDPGCAVGSEFGSHLADTYVAGTPPYGRSMDSCPDSSCDHDWRMVGGKAMSMVFSSGASVDDGGCAVTYRRDFVCDSCGATMHDFKDVRD